MEYLQEYLMNVHWSIAPLSQNQIVVTPINSIVQTFVLQFHQRTNLSFATSNNTAKIQSFKVTQVPTEQVIQ